MPAAPRTRQPGLTLVEAAAALAVVSVLLGSGLPALAQLRATQHLNAAAALLRTDVQYARSAAVATGQTVRLRAVADADGTCYVIHTGAPSSCSCAADGTARCSGASWSLRSVRFERDQGISVGSSSATMTFDGTQGTVTPTGTLTLANDRGAQLRVVVNVMGRTRTCQAAGSPAGHPAC